MTVARRLRSRARSVRPAAAALQAGELPLGGRWAHVAGHQLLGGRLEPVGRTDASWLCTPRGELVVHAAGRVVHAPGRGDGGGAGASRGAVGTRSLPVWSPPRRPAAREGCSTFFHHEHAPVARDGCASGLQPDVAARFRRARAGAGVARRGRASEKTSSSPSRGVLPAYRAACCICRDAESGFRLTLPFIRFVSRMVTDRCGRLRAAHGMGVTRRCRLAVDQ